MMARPSPISHETRHFYSREYYWYNYRHEENNQVDQCYQSHVDATDSPVARVLPQLRHRTSRLPKI